MNSKNSPPRIGVLMSAVVLLSGGTAGAAGSAAGTIDRMMMDEHHGTKLFVNMSVSVVNPASCSTHPSWGFVLDTSTELGWQMYAILMNAQSKNSQIALLGNNTCGLYPGIETLRRIELL